NTTASVLLALYIATAKRRGIAATARTGTVQNDILKEYVARGTYIFPPGPSMRLCTDTFAYCKDHVPRWNTISISGYHMREAGCTAVQEVAFTLANGMAYVRAALGAGLGVDEFAPQLSFFFNAHNNLIEEVAKFRAARRLWARIMRDEFGARDPRSQALRFHAQTAGSMLTAQQPENNLVRVAVQAIAAIPFMQREIQDAAYRYQREVEERARIVVGVNEYLTDEPSPTNLFQVDPAVGDALAEKVARVRAKRDRGGALRALDALEAA